MPDFCALCGVELPRFRKKSLVCCGESQYFCQRCFDEMDAIDHIARTRILLERGRRAVNAEHMKKVLQRIDDEAQAKRKAESTDLTCIRCSAPMKKLGRKQFQMGRENFFIDTHMWEGSLELEVLCCTKCKKVEFFLPE